MAHHPHAELMNLTQPDEGEDENAADPVTQDQADPVQAQAASTSSA